MPDSSHNTTFAPQDAAFFRSILEAIPAPLVVFDAGRRYLFCNAAAIRNPQIREWIIGHDDFEYCAYRGFPPELAHKRQQQFDEAQQRRETVTFEETFQSDAGDIHQLRRITPLYSADGQLQYFLGYGLDITELKAVQQQLHELNMQLKARVQARTLDVQAAAARLEHGTLHDALTNLPNRAAMRRFAQGLLNAGKLDTQPYGLLMIDTDRFKTVNDSLGHAAGDQILIALSRRLERLIPVEGLLGRLGSDEFMLMVPVQRPEDIDTYASALLDSLSAPFEVQGHEILLTASIGSVFVGGSYHSSDEMFTDADIALHKAKAAGRAQHQPFDLPMRQKVQQTAQTEKDLRQALRPNEAAELTLYYQPILDLRTGGIHGFEALLRWNHPTRGLLGPMDFLPVAQEAGLMPDINAWVLRAAAEQIHAWQMSEKPAPTVRLSVNVSGDYFTRAGLLQELTELTQEFELRPGKLSLELTESVLLNHSQALGNSLQELSELGFDLHIDDFGTGYSSLSYIQSYPFNMLKIDRSFVQRMTQERSSAELVRTIIAMAKNLRMRVTAEGIETPEQRQMLQAMHCDYGQGYLFARPLPAEQAWAFWQAHKE